MWYPHNIFSFSHLADCFEPGVQYAGGHILEKGYHLENITSVFDCQALCGCQEGCKFFTYRGAEHENANTCWLKKSKGKKHQRGKDALAISGPVLCGVGLEAEEEEA